MMMAGGDTGHQHHRNKVILQLFTVLVWLTRIQCFMFHPDYCYDASPERSALSRTSRRNYSSRKAKQGLYLVPIATFQDEISFCFTNSTTTTGDRCYFDQNGRLLFPEETANQDDSFFEICIAEQEDLPEVCLFLLKSFGANLISTKNFNDLEERFIAPLIRGFNQYAAVVLFAEVLWGLRLRQKDCPYLGSTVGRNIEPNNNNRNLQIEMDPPSLEGLSRKGQVDTTTRRSLLLTVAREGRASNESKWASVDSNIDVIASVELQLQPCDGKQPYSWPWLDTLERDVVAGLYDWLGFPKDCALQPYLSSLCVDEQYRGKRLGRALVRYVESIAANKWGYSKLYLHVDADNPAALQLYRSEGYRDADAAGVQRWSPKWARTTGNISNANSDAGIKYLVKNIKKV